MNSPSSSTQGEETWTDEEVSPYWIGKVPFLRGKPVNADYLNRLEAEARAARLARTALERVIADYQFSAGKRSLEQVYAKTHAVFAAVEALSAIAELNQGGQHAE